MSRQFIVRVKRKRDQCPSDEITLVGLSNGNAKKPSRRHQQIDNELASQHDRKYVLLKRIKSIPISHSFNLDNETFQQLDTSLQSVINESGVKNNNNVNVLNEQTKNLQEAIFDTQKDGEIFTEIHGKQLKRKETPHLMVSYGKKVIKNEKSDVIVVDMVQLSDESHKITSFGYDVSKSSSTSLREAKIEEKKVTKILNPILRMMEDGIKLAFTTGDFSGIMLALSQGVDPNYQTIYPINESGLHGMNALMIASMYKNIVLVKRLIQEKVDVLRTSSEGLTPMDFLMRTTLDYVSLEIRLLLQQAIIQKSHMIISDPNTTSSTDSEEYVVDLFCLPSTAMDEATPRRMSVETEPVGVESNVSMMSTFIQIDGVHISNDGNIELVFDGYDSDWSDLADDEDPDSNDERYYGNDYPEEEEDGYDDGLAADMDDISLGKSHTNLDDRDDDEVDHGVDDEEEYGGYDQDDSMMMNDHQYEDVEIENEINQKQLLNRKKKLNSVLDTPTWSHHTHHQNKSTAKVLRPHIMEYGKDHDGVTLRNFWDYDNNATGPGEGVNESHQSRLNAMRDRSGLLFGSNPREFDQKSLLPKYGNELSDEEEMTDWHSNERDGKYLKPSLNTAAYDVELDNSDHTE